jgi:hypothetical protein
MTLPVTAAALLVALMLALEPHAAVVPTLPARPGDGTQVGIADASSSGTVRLTSSPTSDRGDG